MPRPAPLAQMTVCMFNYKQGMFVGLPCPGTAGPAPLTRRSAAVHFRGRAIYSAACGRAHPSAKEGAGSVIPSALDSAASYSANILKALSLRSDVPDASAAVLCRGRVAQSRRPTQSSIDCHPGRPASWCLATGRASLAALLRGQKLALEELARLRVNARQSIERSEFTVSRMRARYR
jgi:hypothetical protein